MPTVQAAAALPAVSALTPALNYHGGPIMPSIGIYNIYWVGELSNKMGTASLTGHYEGVAIDLAADYSGHSIDSNNTQYYQTSPTEYVDGLSSIGSGGSYGGAYVDTDPFPASACTDSVTPGNCITDAQLQAEIKKVLALKGWTGGLNKIFVVYTGPGEGSCFTSAGGAANCAYTGYCAYHSSISGTAPIIYANMPFPVLADCSVPGQGFPTGDAPADAVANVASHELSEAITDPEGTAWWDAANGMEIGDLCAWGFGVNGYDAGLANQSWNGRFYELQREYDNHVAGCVQVGP